MIPAYYTFNCSGFEAPNFLFDSARLIYSFSHATKKNVHCANKERPMNELRFAIYQVYTEVGRNESIGAPLLCAQKLKGS